MGEERKKAGFWPRVVALLIGLPVLYVASFGPACWDVMRTNSHLAQPIGRCRFGFDQPHPRFDAVYWPIGWCAGREPIPGMRPAVTEAPAIVAWKRRRKIASREIVLSRHSFRG